GLTDGALTESYAYDSVRQLTGVTRSAGGPATIGYALDGEGNRIHVTQDNTTINYTTNLLNQYTSVGGRSLSYDAAGNLASDGLRSFPYDSQNHLVSATTRSRAASYSYDALGRRIRKDVSDLPVATPPGVLHDITAPPPAPEVTKFVYDGYRV